MRINAYLAQSTGMSRRQADAAIVEQRVLINEEKASLGQEVDSNDRVTLDGRRVQPAKQSITIMLNKPAGYVCSRNGQGSDTIYDLLPAKYHQLKPIGRLDKDSSGLLLLTNDGQLAQQLTHPSYGKDKVYQVELDKPLSSYDQAQIEQGIKIEDYISQMQLQRQSARSWQVTMHTGKNRQIRRTFAALGYEVTRLHRIKFGPYKLDGLESSKIYIVS